MGENCRVLVRALVGVAGVALCVFGGQLKSVCNDFVIHRHAAVNEFIVGAVNVNVQGGMAAAAAGGSSNWAKLSSQSAEQSFCSD